jgi:hypothetical protein
MVALKKKKKAPAPRAGRSPGPRAGRERVTTAAKDSRQEAGPRSVAQLMQGCRPGPRGAEFKRLGRRK